MFIKISFDLIPPISVEAYKMKKVISCLATIVKILLLVVLFPLIVVFLLLSVGED